MVVIVCIVGNIIVKIIVEIEEFVVGYNYVVILCSDVLDMVRFIVLCL